MKKVHAIYENGIFRPTDPIELPEHCEVEFEPRVVEQQREVADLSSVYEVLAKRYASGESDVAAQHNEHQPFDKFHFRRNVDEGLAQLDAGEGIGHDDAGAHLGKWLRPER